MFQERKTVRPAPLTFSNRPHRVATRIADKAANPNYSKFAHQTWISSYRNAYEVMAAEAPMLSRRLAFALCLTAFILGMLLRGAL